MVMVGQLLAGTDESPETWRSLCDGASRFTGDGFHQCNEGWPSDRTAGRFREAVPAIEDVPYKEASRTPCFS